jgi:hypothetical protein
MINILKWKTRIFHLDLFLSKLKYVIDYFDDSKISENKDKFEIAMTKFAITNLSSDSIKTLKNEMNALNLSKSFISILNGRLERNSTINQESKN